MLHFCRSVCFSQLQREVFAFSEGSFSLDSCNKVKLAVLAGHHSHSKKVELLVRLKTMHRLEETANYSRVVKVGYDLLQIGTKPILAAMNSLEWKYAFCLTLNDFFDREASFTKVYKDHFNSMTMFVCSCILLSHSSLARCVFKRA